MKSIFVLFVSILFASCVTPFEPTISEKFDDFEQRKFVNLNANDLSMQNSDERVLFDMYASIGNSDTSYYLKLYYYADDWIFIDESNPATLIIDGQKTNIQSATDVKNEVQENGRIREIITIPTDKSFIKTIANSNYIKIRLNGKYVYDATFKQVNLSAVRDFCRRMRI